MPQGTYLETTLLVFTVGERVLAASPGWRPGLLTVLPSSLDPRRGDTSDHLPRHPPPVTLQTNQTDRREEACGHPSCMMSNPYFTLKNVFYNVKRKPKLFLLKFFETGITNQFTLLISSKFKLLN